MRRGGAYKRLRWVLAALAILGVVATIPFLFPPKVGIIVDCLSHLVSRVDPTAIRWELDSSSVAGLTKNERVHLSNELSKVGIMLSEVPSDHRIVLMRVHRVSASRYVVVAGAYAPPWGGQEIEFTASVFSGWEIVRRITIRQS